MAFKIICLVLALAAVSYGYPYYVPYEEHSGFNQGYPASTGINVSPSGSNQGQIGYPTGYIMYPGVPTEYNRNFGPGGIENGYRPGVNVGGFGPGGFNQGTLGPASPGFGYGPSVQGPLSNGLEQHGFANFPGLGGNGGYKVHGY